MAHTPSFPFRSPPARPPGPASAGPGRALARGACLRLTQPVLLRAEHGTLWITVDGRRDDIVLEAGQSRRLDAAAPIIVCALGGPARLSSWPLDAARPWTRRAGAALSGLGRRLARWAGPRGPRPQGAVPSLGRGVQA